MATPCAAAGSGYACWRSMRPRCRAIVGQGGAACGVIRSRRRRLLHRRCSRRFGSCASGSTVTAGRLRPWLGGGATCLAGSCGRGRRDIGPIGIIGVWSASDVDKGRARHHRDRDCGHGAHCRRPSRAARAFLGPRTSGVAGRQSISLANLRPIPGQIASAPSSDRVRGVHGLFHSGRSMPSGQTNMD